MATVLSPRRPKTRAKFRTFADVLKRLGVTADRVRVDLKPGRATVVDVIVANERRDGLYELVDGFLVEKVMGATEAFLALELAFFVRLFLEQHDHGFLLGPDGTLRIMPHLVRIPDLSFISWLRRPQRTVPAEPVPELVPDLAVEVLSKKNTKGEMDRKRVEYFQAGVRLVWLIDPEKRTAVVYRSLDDAETIGESGSLDGGNVLPGFSLPLRKLFAKLEKPAARRRK